MNAKRKSFSYPNGLSAGCCGNCNFELPNFLWITSVLCRVSARAGFGVPRCGHVSREVVKMEQPCFRQGSQRRGSRFHSGFPSLFRCPTGDARAQATLHAQWPGATKESLLACIGFPTQEFLVVLMNQPCPTPSLVSEDGAPAVVWGVGQVALFFFLCWW